ncbi:putative pyrroloquinoline-quinone binding quinoprotein [Gelidibacter sediminis]|uniref:Putative pyrroloquinoline-quinone binding quinoprotein n=1 Tax=Gelidibacter sediminis TaxID=1608710 RepID=A0A4V3F9E9_9FLAO|nr:PQQ-binding-like beta-propeller repeat protein [Gelidibacter sediminis]TDU43946.1 putative pyrroloquinoline-quinone binding quinoprotein [Gelidibacter sediminis]
MRALWLLFTFILVISCTSDTTKHTDLINLAPTKSAVIIKTSSVEGLISAFKNNSLLNQFSGASALDKLHSQLQFLEHLKPSEDILLTFGRLNTDSLQVSVITKYHKDLFNLDSVPNHSVETLTSKGVSVIKTTIDNTTIYSVIKDSIFFASNDRLLTETAFEKRTSDPEFKRLYQTTGNGKSLSIILKTKPNFFEPKWFFDKQLNTLQLSNYMLLDAELNQDQLKFNGITTTTDSLKSLINVFKNTIPQENHLPKISPPDVDGFLSFSFHNYKIFNDNLSAYRRGTSTNDTAIFESIMEVGILYKNEQQALFLNSIDAPNMSNFLGVQSTVETYRDVTIYDSDHPSLFSNVFSPFISYKDASKYINIGDYFVFSDNLDVLRDIISSYQNGNTLSTSAVFIDLMAQLSDESSLFVYANGSHLKSILNSNFTADNPINPDGFNASALQFVYDTDFAHVHGITQKNKKKATSNAVYEDMSVTLDADVLTNPQFVNNHTNSQMEVVVQDVNNNLYLISKDGKVLWKKQLDSKILGRVEQLDIFKNGRLQLAFATQNQVYVLDRNGKNVGGFPLKFKDQITQPLSVFDYENNRDYRLMVTQGKSVLMYNKQGKIVSGFTYKKADDTINTQPQHLRIGKKDYIVFVQGKELEILNRTGQTRVKVKNNIDFSDSGIFLYNNRFTTTTAKGDLIQIDGNGKLSSANLNLGEKHAITATSKTLVTLSENILHIKSHKVELDFGEYTPPKIFYINDKIYVSVTDLQAKKVHLFDSLGKPIDNFPVYGISAIDLDNIDKEKRPEFVTVGDRNSIIIYQMN